MRITKITSDKKYAKLDEDISFAIEYEAPLTDEELQTEWEVYVGNDGTHIMTSTLQILFSETRDASAM